MTKDELQHIHDRVQAIANAEVKAAWIRGAAADGRFIPEKERLLDEAEHTVDELEKGLLP
jgi:hypothetical protein